MRPSNSPSSRSDQSRTIDNVTHRCAFTFCCYSAVAMLCMLLLIMMSVFPSQVSRFFSEVFKELVPDGTGQLMMKTITDDVSFYNLCCYRHLLIGSALQQ